MDTMKHIAVIRNDFPTKFGLPRQSGLVPELRAQIVFAPEYRNADALRGMEGYSHFWLIWAFSEAKRDSWSPTVRPPRLGGNTRVGVFSTRSPFRPNPIGLSCVKLEHIEFQTPEGPVLHISGADLMDGTPIYDIKPYLPFADCIPEATGGFAAEHYDHKLEVICPPALLESIPPKARDGLFGVLAQDPRPAYQHDPERIYGFSYSGHEIRFRVCENRLTVCEIVREEDTK